MKKNIIKVINEEISSFDFLNQEKLQEEDNLENFLKSDDFQKKLVYDLANNLKNPQLFKDVDVVEQSSNVEELNPDSTQKLNVTYIIEFIYNYNGKDLPLSVLIEADDIWQDLNVKQIPGDRYTEPCSNAELNFNWEDFRVKVIYGGEIEVELDWLYKNKNVYRKFLEHFIGNLVAV